MKRRIWLLGLVLTALGSHGHTSHGPGADYPSTLGSCVAGELLEQYRPIRHSGAHPHGHEHRL